MAENDNGLVGQPVIAVRLMAQDESKQWVPMQLREGGLSMEEPGVKSVTGTSGVTASPTTGAVVVQANVDAASVTINGSNQIQRAALTGDVTASAGANATTIAADAVTDTKLRNSNGLSVIGRSANSTGDPADIVAANDGDALFRNGTSLAFGNYGALTTVDPALDDEIPLSDTSASAANKNTTLERLLGFGKHVFEARLTLTSGTPITTTDVTGATTIYLTPYNGNRVRVYDGTRWKVYALTEKSLAIGTLASATIPNDIFLYDNAGTLTLEKLAWSTATARATALTTQDGVYVKNGDTTRLYVGTFYPTATTTTEDSQAKRFLWNMYNRADRYLFCADTTDSWTYTSVTPQEARAQSTDGTSRFSFVLGLSEDVVEALNMTSATNSTASRRALCGIGLDGSTNSAELYGGWALNGSVGPGTLIGKFTKQVAIGYHYLARLEASEASGTTTWYGDTGVSYVLSGMSGRIRG